MQKHLWPIAKQPTNPSYFMLVNGRSHVSIKWSALSTSQVSCGKYEHNRKLIVLLKECTICSVFDISMSHVPINKFWHLPFRYNSVQMWRSESSRRRWRTSLVSVSCHYRPGRRLCSYNESALLAGTRGTGLTWEWAQLFTARKIKWGLFDSTAWLKACRNIPNILNPALGVMRRKRIASFRMQVRLGSDRLSRMCALSLASLLALNGRYCGD